MALSLSCILSAYYLSAFDDEHTYVLAAIPLQAWQHCIYLVYSTCRGAQQCISTDEQPPCHQ